MSDWLNIFESECTLFSKTLTCNVKVVYSPYSISVDVAVTTSLINWMFKAQSVDIIALV